jgi:hypothetical protein
VAQSARQRPQHRRLGLARDPLPTQAKTAGVVDYRQQMRLARRRRHVFLEIHLPQLVGRWALEALQRLAIHHPRQPPGTQYPPHRLPAHYLPVALRQQLPNLARAAVSSVHLELHNQLRQLLGHRLPRPPRPVDQRLQPARLVALHQLVHGAATALKHPCRLTHPFPARRFHDPKPLHYHRFLT